MDGFRFFDAFMKVDQSAREKLFKMIARHIDDEAYMFCLAMTSKRFYMTVCNWHWGTYPREQKRASITPLFKRCEFNVLRYLHRMNFLSCPKLFCVVEIDTSISDFESWRRMCDYIQHHFLVPPGALFVVLLWSDAQKLLEYAIQKHWYIDGEFNEYFEAARSYGALDLIANIVPAKGLTSIDTDDWTEDHFIWWLRNMHRKEFSKEVFFEYASVSCALQRADEVCDFDVLKAMVRFMYDCPWDDRPYCNNLSERVKLLLPSELCACGSRASHDPKLLRPQKRKKL